VESEFRVAGMTCSHCVTSVTEEIKHIPDVRAVRVDLASGSVWIESDAELPRSSVADAVTEAGYELLP
jgi:copper chaperone